MRAITIYTTFLLTLDGSSCTKIPHRRRLNISGKTWSGRNKSSSRNKNGYDVSSPRGGELPTVSLPSSRTITARQMKIMNVFSGGAAGTVAACITSPLEVIKTQLQSTGASSIEGIASARTSPANVIRKIVQADGLAGFFRGLPPTLMGIIPSRSAYFYAYEQTKRLILPIFPDGSVGSSLVAGLAAGVSGNTLTNPIWLVRTRMQLVGDSSVGQKIYTGYGDAISTIYREEGIAGFYKGLFASYWGCAEGCIQFVLYEKIKTKLLKREASRRKELGLSPPTKLSNIAYLGSASFSKGIASLLTYPHEVARTRLREQARSGVFKYKGMWGTLRVVSREEGRKGLYAGMGMHLLKVIPNTGLMFLSYELVNSWLGQMTVVEN